MSQSKNTGEMYLEGELGAVLGLDLPDGCGQPLKRILVRRSKFARSFDLWLPIHGSVCGHHLVRRKREQKLEIVDSLRETGLPL